MVIRRIDNYNGCYEYYLTEGKKELKIVECGLSDVYFVLSNGGIIPKDEYVSLTFDITKENYEIYTIFDKLYTRIITGDVTKGLDMYDYTGSLAYYELVDEDYNIHWVSDEDSDGLDEMVISKLDDDTYRLKFNRTDELRTKGYKTRYGISVKARYYSSNHFPFNYVFMDMYDELNKVDPEYHQVHLEELAYKDKVLSKKK